MGLGAGRDGAAVDQLQVVRHDLLPGGTHEQAVRLALVNLLYLLVERLDLQLKVQFPVEEQDLAAHL